jgi:hypothetical protein
VVVVRERLDADGVARRQVALDWGPVDAAPSRSGAPLGAVAVLSTLRFGGRLGRRSHWRELGLAALAGTAELLFMYGVAMVVSPDPNNTNDIAAGAGVVILSVPTLLVVASLLGLGGLVGRWSRRR